MNNDHNPPSDDRLRGLLASLPHDAAEELAKREPDWNDLCADLGYVELFVEAPALAREVLALRAALAHMTEERDNLLKIIGGRVNEPPTIAEAEAHNGAWLVAGERVTIRVVAGPHKMHLRVFPGLGVPSIGDAESRAWLASPPLGRWIPLDHEGRPCPWPKGA